MPDKLDQLDYYTLLGVDEKASVRDIKRAFKEFARKYHPDRHVDLPQEKRARAARIYRRGSEGYQVLTDSAERARYDELLEQGRVRFTAEDRAQVEARKNPTVGKKTQRFRTVEAKAFYNKAVQLVRDGFPRAAWKTLMAALNIEPDNDFLKKSIKKVEKMLR